MLTISIFYGIRICFNLRNKEHGPPHVHAKYGEYIASFNIKDKCLNEGKFPDRATKLVIEFLNQYEQELLKMWETEEYKRLKGLD